MRSPYDMIAGICNLRHAAVIHVSDAIVITSCAVFDAAKKSPLGSSTTTCANRYRVTAAHKGTLPRCELRGRAMQLICGG
jgi:hypothetical protein